MVATRRLGGAQDLGGAGQLRQALGRIVGAGDQVGHAPVGVGRHPPGACHVAGRQRPQCLQPQPMGEVDHGGGVAGVLGGQAFHARDQVVELPCLRGRPLCRGGEA